MQRKKVKQWGNETKERRKKWNNVTETIYKSKRNLQWSFTTYFFPAISSYSKLLYAGSKNFNEYILFSEYEPICNSQNVIKFWCLNHFVKLVIVCKNVSYYCNALSLIPDELMSCLKTASVPMRILSLLLSSFRSKKVTTRSGKDVARTEKQRRTSLWFFRAVGLV